jgi:hypothetical protein
MNMMYRATRSVPELDVIGEPNHYTRIAEDSELLTAHPECGWQLDTTGPPSDRDAIRVYAKGKMHAGSDFNLYTDRQMSTMLDDVVRGEPRSSTGAPLNADEPARVVEAVEHFDHGRESGRFERPEDARERKFWASTERFLERLEPPEPNPDVYDLDRLEELAAAAAAREIDEIDAGWGPDAPWLK